MGNLATKVGDYITRYSATDFDVVDYDVFRKAYEKV